MDPANVGVHARYESKKKKIPISGLTKEMLLQDNVHFARKVEVVTVRASVMFPYLVEVSLLSGSPMNITTRAPS